MAVFGSKHTKSELQLEMFAVEQKTPATARPVYHDAPIQVERRQLTEMELEIQKAVENADKAYIAFCNSMRYNTGEENIRNNHELYLHTYNVVAALIAEKYNYSVPEMNGAR